MSSFSASISDIPGGDVNRQAQLIKKRNEMMAEFAEKRAALQASSSAPSISRFTSTVQDNIDDTIRKETEGGLFNLEELREKRRLLEEERDRKVAGTDLLASTGQSKKRKIQKKAKAVVSFGDEESENELETPIKLVKKFAKNPTVDTSFLPDKEREEEERKEKELLRLEWLDNQKKMKEEDIEVIHSFWDGTGHRGEVVCKKGDSIGIFLGKVRKVWPQLSNTSVDNLMFIKEDLIIPPNLTFYDFAMNKWQGKTGPLFNFEPIVDPLLCIGSAKSKDESSETHAGKVIERSWYMKNKHHWPASRWEIFNPQDERWQRKS